MDQQNTDPAVDAAKPQPEGPDAILAAAAPAAADAQPEVTPQPPELAELARMQSVAVDPARRQITGVYLLEVARGLPERVQMTADQVFEPYEDDAPHAIKAFQDTDGRTMRVVLDEVHGLAKVEVRREQQAGET